MVHLLKFLPPAHCVIALCLDRFRIKPIRQPIIVLSQATQNVKEFFQGDNPTGTRQVFYLRSVILLQLELNRLDNSISIWYENIPPDNRIKKIRVDHMEFIQHAINWCKGEIFEGSMFAIYGTVLVLVSMLFRKIGNTPFTKAMIIPLLVRDCYALHQVQQLG